jgi:hypothetical protein
MILAHPINEPLGKQNHQSSYLLQKIYNCSVICAIPLGYQDAHRFPDTLYVVISVANSSFPYDSRCGMIFRYFDDKERFLIQKFDRITFQNQFWVL